MAEWGCQSKPPVFEFEATDGDPVFEFEATDVDEFEGTVMYPEITNSPYPLRGSWQVFQKICLDHQVKTVK